MATAHLPQKRLYAVIHCIDPHTKGGIGHALANTRIALMNGADGVFLIGHGMDYRDLIMIYDAVRKQNPAAWIGVNFLDLSTTEIQEEVLLAAINQCVDLSAIWMDALPDEDFDAPPWVEIFGGVAFKYLNSGASGEALKRECKQAIFSVTCATTSGDKTGSPPSIEKLREIRKYLGGHAPLAVASGVNLTNADEILEYANCILVASSITEQDPSRGNHEHSLEYLVPEKVAALAAIVRKKNHW